VSDIAATLVVNRRQVPDGAAKYQRQVAIAVVVDDDRRVVAGGAHVGEIGGVRAVDYSARPKSSNGWFRRAVKTAGIQAVTPHDLRDSCASLAVSAGVNVLALARMLGHKDPA
jgi:integrase